MQLHLMIASMLQVIIAVLALENIKKRREDA
jgi:hypothetical protein